MSCQNSYASEAGETAKTKVRSHIVWAPALVSKSVKVSASLIEYGGEAASRTSFHNPAPRHRTLLPQNAAVSMRESPIPSPPASRNSPVRISAEPAVPMAFEMCIGT
ncbi:hypothetical protein VTO42DRAFT_1134 [Malbranchea cinnamomea]